MASSKITCKFFKLTGVKNLLEVKSKILNRTFSEPVLFSKSDNKIISTMPEKEKNFYFTWGDVTEPNILEVSSEDSEKKLGDFSVEYIIATANIEYPKRKKRDSFGNILPKSQRVNFTQVSTYFLKLNKSIYMIICTSNDTHQDRVKKLVGTSFIIKGDKDYLIPSDLFNWLFYQFVKNQGSLSSELKLTNISGFIGNSIDEHNVFKGISDQTSELIITKAFISNGGILKTITARLKNKDIDIVFSIDYESNAQIYINQSEKLKLLESEEKNNFIIIYLYSYLLPLLKTIYNKSSEQFLSNEKNEFSEEIGLEVIKSIIENNSLSSNDVLGLFTSNYDKREENDEMDFGSTVNLKQKIN